MHETYTFSIYITMPLMIKSSPEVNIFLSFDVFLRAHQTRQSV